MRIPDAVMDHVDLITAVWSFLGSLACLYLAKIIRHENQPGVVYQQVSLAALSIALMANSVYVFPDWALLNGHRPTGILVESTAAINAIVAAGRAYIRYRHV